VATVEPFIRIRFGQMADAQGLDDFLVGDNGFVIDDLRLPNYQNVPFDFAALGDAIDLAILYEEAHGNRQIRDYCSQMVTRFKSLLERQEYAFLRHEQVATTAQRENEPDFLAKLIGLRPTDRGYTKAKQIVILDMNAVQDEVVELVSAVISRMLFRLLRQADPRNRFPVHLLLEEAHRYIASTPSRYAVDATKIFERIAKEGRKYGMFLMVASQRPIELSKTVLSQCSNFVVHRIQNPDDLS
jgi:DNA helicase HerA-like ATPase